MAYTIHTTPAIIIQLFPEGEESVIAECFTELLGRIYVHIQGAKKIQNKHRMHVFLFALIILDCVEGKQYFRCTGISEYAPHYQSMQHLSPHRRKIVTRMIEIVRRLVPVKNPVPQIFHVMTIFINILDNKEYTDSQIDIFFLITQLRILGILGYWNSDWTDSVFQIDGKTFHYVTENKKPVQQLIEKIFQETQLIHNG